MPMPINGGVDANIPLGAIFPKSAPPSDPVGSYMEAAQGMQNLKRSKIENQRAQVGLEQQNLEYGKQQQMRAEEKALSMIDWNQFKKEDGTLDADAASAAALQAAPTFLGQQKARELQGLAQDQIAVRRGYQALNNEHRQAIATQLSSLGTKADYRPKDLLDVADQIKETNKDPDVREMVNTLVDHTLRMPIDQQRKALTRIGLGSGSQETITGIAQPGVGANASGQVSSIDRVNNTVTPMAGGNPTSSDVAATTDVKRAGAEAYTGALSQASNIPMEKNVLENIIKLADQVTTGPETDRVNKIKAMVGNAIPGAKSWKDSSSAYQEITKYMEQNALQQWHAAGGSGTNAQLETQKAGNPNNQYNSQTVKDLAKWVLAGKDAHQAYTNALVKWARQPGNTAADTQLFQNKWANIMDPRVFQIEHMTPEEIVKKFPSKEERADIRKKSIALNKFMANPE